MVILRIKYTRNNTNLFDVAKNMQETVHQIRRKLIWRANRGLLELELQLKRYFDAHIGEMPLRHLLLLEEFLAYDDVVLYDWLRGLDDSCPAHLVSIVQQISVVNRR